MTSIKALLQILLLYSRGDGKGTIGRCATNKISSQFYETGLLFLYIYIYISVYFFYFIILVFMKWNFFITIKLVMNLKACYLVQKSRLTLSSRNMLFYNNNLRSILSRRRLKVWRAVLTAVFSASIILIYVYFLFQSRYFSSEENNTIFIPFPRGIRISLPTKSKRTQKCLSRSINYSHY